MTINSQVEAQNNATLIGVATFKRPKQLQELLESLEKLSWNKLEMPRVEIAIVDNDADESARELVEMFAKNSHYPITYLTESRRGVSHVRNTALEFALSHEFDFLAFIDDDETAHTNWLEALLIRQNETKAGAVFGQVNSQYNEDAPDWIAAWRPHAHIIETDGIPDKPGGTCNVLIDLQAVQNSNIRFDPKMSLTGGEDTLFFYEMQDAGYTFASAAAAIVDEDIPSNRAQPNWILKRWYRTGMTDLIIINRHSIGPVVKLKAVLGGLVRLTIGSTAALLFWIANFGKLNKKTMEKLYTAYRGAGMLSFAFGRTYEEYGSKKSD